MGVYRTAFSRTEVVVEGEGGGVVVSKLCPDHVVYPCT